MSTSRARINYFILTLLLISFSFYGIISMQSAFDASKGGNRTISSIITLFIEVFYIINILNNIKYIGKSGLTKLVYVWMFFMFISVLVTSKSLDRLFKDIVYTQFWCLSYLYVFVMTKKKNFGIYLMKKYFLKIFIVNLLLFFYVFRLKFGITSNFEGSNQIYYPLLLLPWVFLLKEGKLKFLLLIVLLCGVIYSFKRNTMMLYSLCILIYIHHTYIKSDKSSTLIKGVFIIISLVLTLSYIGASSIESQYILDRFTFEDLDKATGRKAIWYEVIELLKYNTTSTELVFGHGHNSVKDNVKIFGYNLSAHNDFLEVLFDYGLILLLFYIILYLLLIKRLFYLKNNLKKYYVPYAVSLVLFGGMSMVSHLVLYPTFFIFTACFWGAIESEIGLFKRKKYSQFLVK